MTKLDEIKVHVDRLRITGDILKTARRQFDSEEWRDLLDCAVLTNEEAATYIAFADGKVPYEVVVGIDLKRLKHGESQ